MCCVVRAAFVCRRRTGGGSREPKATAPLLDHDSLRPHRYLGRRLLRVHDSSDPSSKRAVRCGRSQKRRIFLCLRFVLRAIRAEERDWREDKKLFEVVLLLTTYESGKPELVVPPVALYYFRRDGTVSEKEARAQAIRIPPQKIALRSTLPGGQQPRLREFKQIQPVEPTYAIGALVLGLIGMGFVGSRAAARLWHAVHRDKAIKRPVSRRVRERWVHEGLQRIRLMAKEPPKDPQAFYAEIGQFMRQYLTEWLNVEARGLTPGEAEQALHAAGYNGAFAQRVRTVLEQCEEAQYGKRDGGPAGNGQHQTSLLDSLEQAIKMTPRAR